MTAIVRPLSSLPNLRTDIRLAQMATNSMKAPESEPQPEAVSAVDDRRDRATA